MKLGGRFTADDYAAMQIADQIDAEGVEIELTRESDYVDDGEGGVIRPDGNDRKLVPQKFLFQEAAPVAHVARGTNFQEIIGYGQRATTNFVLVGLVDANVRKDDCFEIGPDTYTVKFVHPDRKFMTLAELERVSAGNG